MNNEKRVKRLIENVEQMRMNSEDMRTWKNIPLAKECVQLLKDIDDLTMLFFIDVISEYSWGILKMPADDEFIYAVCAAFDVYEDDIYQNAGSYSSEISYDDSTFSITMQRYNDPEEAEFFFEDGCTYLLELLEIDINDCEYYYDEEEGGFLLFDSTYSPAADQTLYGGLYYCDDTCIVAMTFDEADYDSIDELLYILNLPTP
jgi:hypothetical protein